MDRDELIYRLENYTKYPDKYGVTQEFANAIGSAADDLKKIQSLRTRVAELEQAVVSANTAAKVHYDKLTANNEVYRVEMERTAAQLTAAQAQNAGLRAALEDIGNSRYLHFCANPDCKSDLCQDKRRQISAIEAALSDSPAQSVARLKAEAWRDLAAEVHDFDPACADWIAEKSRELEAAAKGEVKNGATD